MKAWRRSFLCSNFKECAILVKFLLSVRDGHSPNVIWISCVEFVRRCDFSGFAFRRLLLNYLNKVPDIFSRWCNTLFKFMWVEWGMLVISRSWKNWNKSHRNMLNSIGPSMELCGTAKIISNHDLFMTFNFSLCFCKEVLYNKFLFKPPWFSLS